MRQGIILRLIRGRIAKPDLIRDGLVGITSETGENEPIGFAGFRVELRGASGPELGRLEPAANDGAGRVGVFRSAMESVSS